MSKFAVLEEKELEGDYESEGIKYWITYYGGDKPLSPAENAFGPIKNISMRHSHSSALEELSINGYIPQCKDNGKLYFIKKGFFS